MLYHSIKGDIFVSLKCFYGCGLSPHFLFTKLDQGETVIWGVTQYLVLKWFTTHLTSKECSECIHRSAFVNIYCSRWTLLPDSKYTDAIFHLQTKAHVWAVKACSMTWGSVSAHDKTSLSAAWGTEWGSSVCSMTSNSLFPSSAFFPPLWSRLYFSCIVIFFQPFCMVFLVPPLPAFVCEWVEGWMGMCESKGGRWRND